MATYTKAKLSGSTDGKPILVAATATPGTAIHTPVTGSTSWDEIWIWTYNMDTVDRTLTIEYGGAGTTNEIKVTVPATSGLVHVIPGLIINNGATTTIKAYGSVTNKLTVSGYVNQIV